MTIASATPSFIQSPGNGTATNFAFPFKIFAATDLRVGFIVAGVYTQQLGGFSVENIDVNGGGNAVFATPPPVGTTIDIRTDTPLTQTTEFANLGAFLPEAHTEAFDRLTRILQDLFRLTYTFGVHGPDQEDVPWTALPNPAARANMALLFDGNGLPTIGAIPTIAFTQSIWNAFLAASTPYLAQVATITQGFNDLDNIAQLVVDLQNNAARSIECYGDSTMYGSNPGGSGQVSIPPPLFLQNTLNTWTKNSAVTVLNQAIPGTCLSQMLAGTDGSGSTFAAKMAASSAKVVYCNHGINDLYGHAPFSTTLAVYRANLIQFIQICRANGKVPVLVTLHPVIPIGTFGQVAGYANAPAWTYLAAQGSQVMRDLAIQHGATLVDTHKYLTLTLGTDNSVAGVNLNEPLTWFPDGVHGTQTTYYQTGQNLTEAILGSLTDTVVSDMQVIPSTRAAASARTPSLAPSATSRYGESFEDSSAAAQVTVVFKVSGPGFDLSLLHPCLNGLTQSMSVQLDGTVLITMAQGLSSFTGANFLQDYETQLVRQLNPGFHMLILGATDTRPIAIHGLRFRKNTRPVINGAASQLMFTRELLFPELSLQGASANAVAVYDTATLPIYIENCQIEWTGQLVKSSGVGLGGYYGNNSSAPTAQQTIMLGLNSAGFLTVTEANNVGSYNTTVLDATDHSGGSHLYAFLITGINSLQAFLDGSAVGAPVTLISGFYGGNLCLWKGNGGGALIVTNVSRVWTN